MLQAQINGLGLEIWLKGLEHMLYMHMALCLIQAQYATPPPNNAECSLMAPEPTGPNYHQMARTKH